MTGNAKKNATYESNRKDQFIYQEINNNIPTCNWLNPIKKCY